MSTDISNDQPTAPTSEELGDTTTRKKFAISIFDVMLGISLICVVLAIMLLIWDLRSFAPFPSAFPWKTSEILNG